VSIIAIIPARAGSTRIPGKNSREFRGRPIFEYSVQAALQTGIFTRVVVSTDDPFVKSRAYRLGAEVLPRPDHLARNSVGTQEVAADGLKTIRSSWTFIPKPTYACCIYATAPLMHFTDLISGYLKLRSGSAPYVYTVGPDWQDAGQWYWGRASAFMDGLPLDQATLHVLPASRVCDINTEDDWKRAEQMYDQLHKES
jgi:N-acylneuraminate cytidylyltransferase